MGRDVSAAHPPAASVVTLALDPLVSASPVRQEHAVLAEDGAAPASHRCIRYVAPGPVVISPVKFGLGRHQSFGQRRGAAVIGHSEPPSMTRRTAVRSTTTRSSVGLTGFPSRTLAS